MTTAAPITAKDAYKALQNLGYPNAYIKRLLPDWWDNSLLKTSAGALQFAMILGQRLGVSASFSAEGSLSVAFDQSRARFKHRRDTAEGELAVVAGMGRAMARLALHRLTIPYTLPSADPTTLRNAILATPGTEYVGFDALIEKCWSWGIPVLYLHATPSQAKRATGIAVNIGGRPCIILGHSYMSKARQLFALAHELGHIALGHVRQDDLLIDEDLPQLEESLQQGGVAVAGQDAEEQQADAFALTLIRGDAQLALAQMFSHRASPAVLAASAVENARRLAIDPGHLLFSWAKEAGQWPQATRASGLLHNAGNALGTIEAAFLRHTDKAVISEENREFLITVQGFTAPER